MSGKRAWPPPRSRRPSTAAETSGWPPSCRPGLGGDLAAGAAPVSARARRRVPAVRERDPHRVATGEPQRGGARLRRSVSRPGALAERLSATGYRRPLEADNRFAARKGRVNFRQTLWLVGAGHHEHPVAGHPVERAKTPDATPESDLCPMCRAPFLYAQATAVRTAVLMSRKTYCSGGR